VFLTKYYERTVTRISVIINDYLSYTHIHSSGEVLDADPYFHYKHHVLFRKSVTKPFLVVYIEKCIRKLTKYYEPNPIAYSQDHQDHKPTSRLQTVLTVLIWIPITCRIRQYRSTPRFKVATKASSLNLSNVDLG